MKKLMHAEFEHYFTESLKNVAIKIYKRSAKQD